MKRALFLALLLSFTTSAWAADWEDLCKEGFAVLWKATITDDFNGCDHEKIYHLDNGLKFKCSGYSYSYAFRPEFYLLVNVKSSETKYLINGSSYSGSLYK